ncbi:MAG: alpha/beta hydrolase [Pseudomonadota bacterium]
MYTDRDFVNVDFIPGGADYPDRWEAEARVYREQHAAIGRARLNVAYGGDARQKLDIFHPAGKAEGLVFFIHGGYWLRFDRGVWSHFSKGLMDRGWAVALPSYTLAPEARIGQMTREMSQALEAAAQLVPGPICLTGHSAGGHLSARLGCRDVAIAPEVRARVKKIVPISPLTDLRAMLSLQMNAQLQLDAAEAAAESPVLHAAPDADVTVWVGAEERPVFLDQAIALRDAWGCNLRVDPGRHHFDVIDGLQEAESPIVAELLAGV